MALESGYHEGSVKVVRVAKYTLGLWNEGGGGMGLEIEQAGFDWGLVCGGLKGFWKDWSNLKKHAKQYDQICHKVGILFELFQELLSPLEFLPLLPLRPLAPLPPNLGSCEEVWDTFAWAKETSDFLNLSNISSWAISNALITLIKKGSDLDKTKVINDA